MSPSIAIPKRRKKLALREQEQSPPAASSFASSTAGYTSHSEAESSSRAAGKRREGAHTHSHTSRTEPEALTPARTSEDWNSGNSGGRERRFSLLNSSLSEAQHTVINIGGPDHPRLITCVRSSQGFDWNQELFLPSYIDHDSLDLEHKQDPVEEIRLTEEELANMLPS